MNALGVYCIYVKPLSRGKQRIMLLFQASQDIFPFIDMRACA